MKKEIASPTKSLALSLSLTLSLSLSLSLAACTRDWSLGAAGDSDGGSDLKAPADADRPDNTQNDGPLDLVLRDAAGDGPLDLVPGDAPDQQCFDRAVAYNLGDVIPRGTSSCQMTCLCLAGGVIGACTGACPTDASPDGPPDPSQIAVLTVSRSTSSPAILVFVFDDGSAERTIIRQPGDAFGDRAFNYPAGSPEVTLFLYHLGAVGDLATVGDPSSSISTESCAKSVSFGTTTKVEAGAVTSGDLQCLIDPTAAQIALAHDADVLTGTVSSTFGTTANLCIATLGTISSQLVCTGTRSDFPDTCLIGICSPPNSQTMVTTCLCPGGGCFTPPYGCVGRPGVCDIGDDQTCNDNIAANAFHGTCLPGRSCACQAGFTIVAASGKCS